ncbi:hypothetical protein CMV_017264 [Castanea mollissima]|uniref:B30.2/SPRY domain-containing protein n=1 Tax=Castanea mollissima TaxID=60419 RepID=A0A8J4R512_9ROSI|nr:hypothetical protein CMV_017264 [Castanea mollissima]
MDSLQATYRDEDEEEDDSTKPTPSTAPTQSSPPTTAITTTTEFLPPPPPQNSNNATEPQNDTTATPPPPNRTLHPQTTSRRLDPPQQTTTPPPPKTTTTPPPPQTTTSTTTLTTTKKTHLPKSKSPSLLSPPRPNTNKQQQQQQQQQQPSQNDAVPTETQTLTLTPTPTPPLPTTTAKKAKKKNNNVWVTKSTRKGKKKNNNNNHNSHNNNGSSAQASEDTVLITPIHKFPDKSDDTPELKICLSKIYKAEKVELTDDRLSAGSTKGYRMVRATRGVEEGSWYFEIKVVRLGETGHTRLGWSTEKGDLQAPVGYDGNSFGYRDIDGSKVHKALREKYGEEGYKEGDVIGFYINLPEGAAYAPKPHHLVLYKGQRYACAPPDAKEEPPKVVPGSEISFFKNGVCQGVAFKDLYGGRYYPAASMYTLPNQPNCVVKFNFGPDFEFFPEDFDGRPVPKPMVEVPYHGFDNRVENGASSEKKH